MANEDLSGKDIRPGGQEGTFREQIRSAGGSASAQLPKRLGRGRIVGFVTLLTALYLLTPPLVAKGFSLAGMDGENGLGTRLMGAVYGPVQFLYYAVPPYRKFIEWQFQALGMEQS